MTSITMKRGAFILFEGVDRCGKTTQCTRLLEFLKGSIGADKVEFMRFPDRTTSIGTTINSYLTNAQEMDDRAIHLLFAANRWEAAANIRKKLAEGVTIVCDRYSYSGVAFTSAKPGMDLDWCKMPEVGLPSPDVVLFLDMSIEQAKERGNFGEERYEKEAFQRTVRQRFQQLMETDNSNVPWKIIDAARTIEEVEIDVHKHTEETLTRISDGATPVGTLW